MDDCRDWIDKHCICATCIHGIDRDLFGAVYCDREDSMAGGWNPGDARCEEHYFTDPGQRVELKRVLNEWYKREYGTAAVRMQEAVNADHGLSEAQPG